MKSAILRYGLVFPIAGLSVFTFGLMLRSVAMPQSSSQSITSETAPPVVFLGQTSCAGAAPYRCREGVPEEFYATLKQPMRGGIHKDWPEYYENPHDKQQANNPPKPEMSSLEDIVKASLEVSTCHAPVNPYPPKPPATFLAGNTSGRCEFSFQYDADGRPQDIAIITCTHESLVKSTRQAVKKWQQEKICSDNAPLGKRQFSTMRYDLVDEDGNRLPYP